MSERHTTAAQSTVVELQQVFPGSAEGSSEAVPQHTVSELRPTDRGWSAWQVLLAAFAFEAAFWGFPTSFGIFQAYYSSLPEFAKDKHNIPIIGTIVQGLVCLGAPFAATLTKRYSRYKKCLILCGWTLCLVGLFAASFAETVPGLVLTQGVMYGIGFVVLTFAIIDIVSEWWIARKGMAFGLISSASGLTGIFMPLVLDALLHRYGYRITLRACAVAMFVLTGPLIPLLKGRIPVSEVVRQPRMDLSFFRKPLFWFYAMAVTIQGFGFFIPPVFVSSYGEAVGLPTTQAALLLSVMALAQTIGQSAVGWLSDTRVHVSLLSSVCCIVAAIATVSLWGVGKSVWSLMLYSTIYGFFAFGFGTLRVAMGRAVSPEPSALLATFSTFVFLQGIGSVLVGPITAALMKGGIDLESYGLSLYKPTVVFVAASSALGGITAGTPYILRRWNVLLG